MSRLGRSLSQVIQIVETLVRRKIRFIAIKEAIEFDGKQDLQTKVMIALFGLFAEVERSRGFRISASSSLLARRRAVAILSRYVSRTIFMGAPD